MAEVKDRSTLGVRYSDANHNSKTFNIGYVNPDNSAATNKILAQKIMELQQNTFVEAYVTDVTNITHVDTDTVTELAFTVASTSNLFSDDSDTYTTAVNAITGTDNHNVVLQINTENKGIDKIYLSLSDIRKAKNLSGLIGLINSKAYSSGNVRYFAKKVNHGFSLGDIVLASPADSVYITEDENTRSEVVAAWVKDIAENLVAVNGHVAEYRQIYTTMDMKGIVLYKEG